MSEIISIQSREFWFKVIEMLQQNWALIEDHEKGATVYFITDGGGIFDEIQFGSVGTAETALRMNGFRRFVEDARAATCLRCPTTPFYRRPHPNGAIYSSGRFWKTN